MPRINGQPPTASVPQPAALPASSTRPAEVPAQATAQQNEPYPAGGRRSNNTSRRLNRKSPGASSPRSGHKRTSDQANLSAQPESPPQARRTSEPVPELPQADELGDAVETQAAGHAVGPVQQQDNDALVPDQPDLPMDEDSTASFSTLPRDVFVPVPGSNRINSYLSAKDLKSLSEVNRAFYEASRETTGPTPSLKISNRAQLQRALEIMNLRHSEGRGIAGITLVGSRDEFTDEDLRPLGNLPSLSKVTLRDCLRITDAGLMHLTHATQVDLTGCDRITDAGLVHLAHATHVHLSGCRQITDAGLAHLTHATHLDVSRCTRITDAGLVHLAHATHINLLWCHRITEAGLVHLAHATHVHLSGYLQITDAGLAHLAQATHVTLSACYLITDSGLAHLTHATHLDFSRCTRITDAGLVHLAQATHVNLTDCTRITDAGLAHLTHATHVNLSRCRGITDAGIERYLADAAVIR